MKLTLFTCKAIYDQYRAEGEFTADKVYPVTEQISDDYLIVNSDSGRGFSIVPGDDGKYYNGGEPFVEFTRSDIEIDEGSADE